MLQLPVSLCESSADRRPETYDEIHEFNFGHDVLLEARKALKITRMDGEGA